jgi:hypothetical protein
MGAFESEVPSYSFTIPRLQELRAARNLEPLKFAKCFYASVDEEILILENLKEKDFQEPMLYTLLQSAPIY